MASKPIVPGIRFHPTDEELFMYYLKRKVTGKPFHQIMAEVDVYKFAPWDLPAMCCLKSKELNWYFFCPRAKKFSSGARANRGTEYGYWKSTGNDRSVEYQGRSVGKIKTLVFYRGKPPKGDRTDWIMHEYRLEDQLLANEGVCQDSFVICKVYQKSGLGPKNGEHYGAPFVEEEWESDDDDNVQANLNANSNHNPDPQSVVHHEDVVMGYSAELSSYDSMGPAPSTVASDSVALVPCSAEQQIAVGEPEEDVMGYSAELSAYDSMGPAPTIASDSVALVPCSAEQQIAPSEPEEDELDRMLAVFDADDNAAAPSDGMTKEAVNKDNCFDGLEDLHQAPQSTDINYSWSQIVAMIDYARQNNQYIEFDDFLI